MREIDVALVEEAVREMCISANINLPKSLEERINAATNEEISPVGRQVLSDICENIKAAREEGLAICQDTGMAVIFIEVGQDVHFVGGELCESINRGVARGYADGFLRCSIVSDPLDRKNTGDNTPAVIHTKIVPGEKVKIDVCPKGFGSENMSAVRMFNPSAGEKEISDFVCDVVAKAGSNPCPPVVVGVGIGGNFEYCAYLAKKALCRDVAIRHEKEFYRNMEKSILEKINRLGIGPQGFGGSVTALAVNIETAPTHIAGLPVAVNMGCHVTRHASRTL
ncbi:MAG TPA: fumarate hydratase [Oscillospiraceae bacterium]|nr:fumarate hydratase [Oscillospiraceae bacterium]